MQVLSDRDFELLDEMVATAGGDTGLVAEVLAESDATPVPLSAILQRIRDLRLSRNPLGALSRYWPHAPASTLRH